MLRTNLHRITRLCLALRGPLLGACLAGALLDVGAARADDIGDFEHARALYEKRDYRGAAAEFQNLAGTEPPRLQNPVLVAESRKYLAASLLFLGDDMGARAAFARLLEQDPDYAIDPLAFPRDVVNLFDEQKRLVLEQRAAEEEGERRRKAEAQRIIEEIARRDRENMVRLQAMAEESHQESSNSRFIASIPFGVGQLQNGHKGFGVALGVSQGIAAATSVVTYIAHQRLADDQPLTESLAVKTREQERLARIANITSFSIFAGLAIVGIIDAHVRFVGTRVSSKPRPLPNDLERWLNERGLSLSARGLHF